MEKLLDEIKEQRGLETFKRSDGLLSGDEVWELPYFSAVIKEGLRCHPAIEVILERVVLPRGMIVAGHYLPHETIVGCTA